MRKYVLATLTLLTIHVSGFAQNGCPTRLVDTVVWLVAGLEYYKQAEIFDGEIQTSFMFLNADFDIKADDNCVSDNGIYLYGNDQILKYKTFIDTCELSSEYNDFIVYTLNGILGDSLILSKSRMRRLYYIDSLTGKKHRFNARYCYVRIRLRAEVLSIGSHEEVLQNQKRYIFYRSEYQIRKSVPVFLILKIISIRIME